MELEKFDLEKAKAGRKVVTKDFIEVTDWAVIGTYICCLTDFCVTPFIVNSKGKSDQYESRDLFLAPEATRIIQKASE